MNSLAAAGRVLLLLTATACGGGDASVAPEPTFYRDPSSALFCSFDVAELNGFLAALGLPAPDPELSTVEGGSCEAFAKALARIADERSGAAYGELGLFFHGLRRFELAEACYLVASGEEPEVPWWPHYRGDLAEAAEDLDRAVELFAEAARLDPRAIAPRARRARALRELGRATEMKEQVEELLGLDPASLLALTELASLALDEGALERAQDLLERAFESWPRQRRVHLLLARLHETAGRPRNAERFRLSASGARELGTLTIDPWMARLEAVTSSILYWKAGADELQQAGRWEELLRVVRELDRREPGPVWKAKEIQALVSLDRVAEALGLGLELTATFGASSLGHEVLAMAHLADRRYDEALASAERAIELDDRSRLGHEVLAKAALGLDDGDRAIEVARAFRELYPGDFAPLALTLLVHQSLAGSTLEESRWPEAAMHLAEVEDALRRGKGVAPHDPRWKAAEEWVASARARLGGG